MFAFEEKKQLNAVSKVDHSRYGQGIIRGHASKKQMQSFLKSPYTIIILIGIAYINSTQSGKFIFSIIIGLT